MAPLQRLPDWQSRLSAYLRDIKGPISFGQHDCCLFAAGAVEAQTGIDLASEWRGRYRSLSGGMRLLRKAGHVGLTELIACHLNEDHPDAATDGDVAVLTDAEGMPALGIIQGAAVYALAAGGGVSLASKTGVKRLFKVS